MLVSQISTSAASKRSGDLRGALARQPCGAGKGAHPLEAARLDRCVAYAGCST
jgi:hypothetical protein